MRLALLMMAATVLFSCATTPENTADEQQKEGDSDLRLASSMGLNGPRLASRPSASYSSEVKQALWSAGKETYVDLRIVVGRDGKVERVSVVESQPINNPVRRAFERESSEYVSRWIFEPAFTTSEKTVAVTFVVRLWWGSEWGLRDTFDRSRFVPCGQSRHPICGVDRTQPAT